MQTRASGCFYDPSRFSSDHVGPYGGRLLPVCCPMSFVTCTVGHPARSCRRPARSSGCVHQAAVTAGIIAVRKEAWPPCVHSHSHGLRPYPRRSRSLADEGRRDAVPGVTRRGLWRIPGRCGTRSIVLTTYTRSVLGGRVAGDFRTARPAEAADRSCSPDDKSKP